ncbi:MAG: D-alanyl-D-alanine carboxypeptidase family protein [[Bacteroides] pectinophilus]|nr:D-alanyl-D-alanine carboxypeptidase family protein [[Bacteroides] pectinophilus]
MLQRRIAGILLTVIVAVLAAVPVQSMCMYRVNAAEPDVESPSVILMEASTGKTVYEKNADETLHPASITKIMTLILIFDALSENKITLDENVTVSEHAASMGGSQVFLEAGEKQTVNTMIKCISVASANDASVAMAEHIWGSEQTFVDKMNERAQGLGMSGTHFVNCCGLDTDGHMMTARDVAIMSRELITRYPQIHEYSGIWMDTITHSTRRGESEFGLSNTNKLIKQYEWATGLKTGSTGLAKCCLSATAEKDGIELIAVVMAAPNSKTRFKDAISLLNYGYGVVDIYRDNAWLSQEKIVVHGGKSDSVACRKNNEFVYVFTEDTDTGRIRCTEEYADGLEAPVYEGDVVGQMVYELDGNILGTIDIVAADTVEKAGLGDCIRSTMMKMLLN